MSKKKAFVLVALALGTSLLGYGNMQASGSAAMPPLQEETPGPTQTPAPTLILEKKAAEKPVNDLDSDGKVDTGDTIRYTITYSNTSPITATNVAIVDNYDETLIESVSNLTGGGTDNGQAITWELGDLASGQGNVVSYQATLKSTLPPGTTALKNEAYISVGHTEVARTSHVIPIQRPVLTIAKAREEVDSNKNGVIDGGDAIKYTILYENTGKAPANDVVIVDDYLEDYVAKISDISSQGNDNGDTITWNVGTLDADASGSLSYKATLKKEALPPGLTSVENQAIISSAETLPERAEATVQVTVPTPTPELPTPTPLPTPLPRETSRENILRESPWLGAEILGLGAIGLAALMWAAMTSKIETTDEGLDRIRIVQEGVCIVLIAIAVVILRLTNCIAEEGTISILSGIVGYVLGRTLSRR